MDVARLGSAMGSVLLGFALAACAAQPPADSPAQVAEQTTRAVYADDLETTAGRFDDVTKKTVKRSEVGELSDRMHALGDFASLTQRSASPDSGQYEYEAAFTRGQLLVQMRLDPDGKIGAYRIVP